MTYVPQAFTALGSSVEATQALYYTGSGLFTPSDLSSYNTNDGGNSITDAVKAAGTGNWTVADLGMSYMIVRSLDPMEPVSYTHLPICGIMAQHPALQLIFNYLL